VSNVVRLKDVCFVCLFLIQADQRRNHMEIKQASFICSTRLIEKRKLIKDGLFIQSKLEIIEMKPLKVKF